MKVWPIDPLEEKGVKTDLFSCI